MIRDELTVKIEENEQLHVRMFEIGREHDKDIAMLEAKVKESQAPL